MQDIIQEIVRAATQLHPFEWLAAILGVIGVWCAKQARIWGYPIGGISVALYCWICYEAGLYAHMGVNAYYFVVNLYGWRKWVLHKKAAGRITFAYCSIPEYIWAITGVLGSFVVLYYVLDNYTDSQVAFLDAFTTALYIVSMILLAHRRIENWIGWIIGDVIAIPLYFSLGLYFTSLQFVVFLGLAVAGFRRWRKAHKQMNQEK